jgi:GT2 family glycosyltransferase
MAKTISVVIVAYGYRGFLKDCLQSLSVAEDRQQVEIILVDNGTEGSESIRIRRELGQGNGLVDRYIRSETNIGYGRAVNLGIEATSSDWVIALNSDTQVGSMVFRRLLSIDCPATARVGFVSVPIYRWLHTESLSVLTNEWQADVCTLNGYLALQAVHAGDIRKEFVVGPSGCAVIMSRQLVSECQRRYGWVYDPQFFLYGEDVDLFLRARRLGYHTLCLAGDPQTGGAIWHIGSASSTGPVSLFRRSPEMIGLAVAAKRKNAFAYASLIELGIVLIAQAVFRLALLMLVAVYQSPSASFRLLDRFRLRISGGDKSRTRRPFFGTELLRAIGVLYRRPLPWARLRLQADKPEVGPIEVMSQPGPL